MISPQGGIRGITLGCAVGTPSYLASAVDGVTAVLGVTKLYTKPGFFIFAGAARRAGPESMLILCLSVNLCICER